MEQKCANCGNGKWRDGITAITDTCIKCHYVDKGALVPQPSNWKQKEQTNGDRIRAMSDEELADWLARTEIDNIAEALKIAGIPLEQHQDLRELTAKDNLEWLKQPAEE